MVFSIISQWALSVGMETSFDPICPKTSCSLSSTPEMLHIKFDQDWPTDLRDIQVQKCGRQTADHWYITSSPCEPSAQVS